MPLKVREMIALLEADGWYLVRTRGSHRHFRHRTKPGTATIAGKPSDTLPAGTSAEHSEAGRNNEEAAVNGYVVVVERAEDGTFGAWSPDLPGVVATAQSYDDCVNLMRDAVAGHLEVMREHGDPIPEPRAIGALTITAA